MKAVATKYLEALASTDLRVRTGRLLDFNGLVLEADGPDVFLGEVCEVHAHKNAPPVPAEVIGFRQGRVLLMPYGNIHGISLESEIVGRRQALRIPVGDKLLGRVVNAFCKPIDDAGPIATDNEYALNRPPINALAREPISDILETGVRAVDSFLTLGKGQRIGIFAGSGVGKTTLLGMLSRQLSADVNVIALIGERGREVWDFVRDTLGPEGLARSVVIVATADEPALVRAHAAHTATAIAEYFRNACKDVLFIMDSITRFAMAQREIGMAAGEPPTSRGYTPSVFSLLPKLLERGGRLRDRGSITAIYSVLVEGDDMNEPVADHMRALLDGHIVLSRDLAAKGHFPAIDIHQSVSRLLPALVSGEEHDIAVRSAALAARYNAAEDLISMGAYQPGSDAELDAAVNAAPAIEAFLRQRAMEVTPRGEAMAQLKAISETSANADTRPPEA